MADQSKARFVVPLACAGITIVLLFATMRGSIAGAIQIGEDEHYEVSKALLYSKQLADRMWNDQPMLHTVLLSLMFKFFGASVVVARHLAAVFGILLFTALFVLVDGRSGRLASFLTLICLITSPETLRLSISVMLEVPAIGVGLWALWAADRWITNSHPCWLVLSGTILALALQIKLTAGFVIPAIVLAIVLRVQRKSIPSDSLKGSFCRLAYLQRSLKPLGIWFTTTIAVFLVIAFFFPSDYHDAWRSHFSAASRQAAQTKGPAFSFLVLLQGPATFLAQ